MVGWRLDAGQRVSASELGTPAHDGLKKWRLVVLYSDGDLAVRLRGFKMFLVMRGECKRRGPCPAVDRDKWLTGLKLGSKHVIYVMRGRKPVAFEGEVFVTYGGTGTKALNLHALDDNRGQAIMDWGRTAQEACACWARSHFDRAWELQQQAKKLEAEANVYAKEFNRCADKGWA